MRSRVGIHAAATLAIAVLALAGVGSLAHATPPGTNGRIVFERLRFQNTPWGELFVMNADGTGVRKLTHPPSGTEDVNADWSPDGSRIVFARAPSSGVHSIWVVKPDGTGLRRLTPNCPPGVGIPKCKADDGWPVWSPDGKHIAFQRLSGPLRPKGATVNTAKRIYRDELVVTDANGRHLRSLVWFGPWRGDPQIPAWSPDGSTLVFLERSDNGGNCSCRTLYVVNANGTGLHRLTPPSIAPGDKVDWSPDGSTILFRTHPGKSMNGSSGLGANLYSIHPDGTGFAAADALRPVRSGRSGLHVLSRRRVDRLRTSAGAVGGVAPGRLRDEGGRHGLAAAHEDAQLRDSGRLGAGRIGPGPEEEEPMSDAKHVLEQAIETLE